MKFDEGKVLNETLIYAIQIANNVFNRKYGVIDKFVIHQISSSRLELLYQNFLVELKINITDYNSTEYIIEYLDICFENILTWEGFGSDMSDKIIIRNQHEVSFLLNLKKTIEKYHAYINEWHKIDYKQTNIKVSLIERYEKIIVELKLIDKLNDIELNINKKNKIY